MSETSALKSELSKKDLRRLHIKLIDLEKKLNSLEKKGTKIKPLDLISIAFFATINSAIIVVSIVLLLLLKTKLI
jgi:hypothetical protein